MPSAPITFTVKGLDDIQRGFRSLRQPELTRTAKPAFAEGSKKVFVPEVRRQAPRGPSPHKSAARGTRGRKGPLHKNVTTRLLPRGRLPASIRSSVLFAYGTSPRAWYRHFVIKGTQRHSLARGARVKGNVNQSMRPIHPGSRGNDFVGRAQKRGEAPFLQHFSGALMSVYKMRAKAK